MTSCIAEEKFRRQWGLFEFTDQYKKKKKIKSEQMKKTFITSIKIFK